MTNLDEKIAVHQNKFIRFAQICLLDKLFDLLLPTDFKTIGNCYNLRHLSLCNKVINKLISKKIISFLEFSLSEIQHWKTTQINMVHRVVVDCSKLNLLNIPFYLKEVR